MFLDHGLRTGSTGGIVVQGISNAIAPKKLITL